MKPTLYCFRTAEQIDDFEQSHNLTAEDANVLHCARKHLKTSIYPAFVHYDGVGLSAALRTKTGYDFPLGTFASEINPDYPYGLFATQESDQYNYNIKLPDTLESYLGSLSRKHRSNFKSYLNKDLTLVPVVLTPELRQRLINMVSVKSPEGGLDLEKYEFFLNYDKAQYLLYSILYNGEVVGFNYGFVYDDSYSDIAFFHDGTHTNLASIVIAKMINLCIEKGIHQYNLGYLCDYKRKFVPEQQKVQSTVILDKPCKLSVPGIHVWPTGYYYVYGDNADVDSLLAKYPFLLELDHKYNYLIQTFNPTVFDIVDGYPFLNNDYFGFALKTVQVRVPVNELPPVEVYNKFIQYHGSAYIDSGLHLVPKFDTDYCLDNAGLKWYDDLDKMVSTMKPKNRPRIKRMLKTMGVVRDYDLTLDELATYTYRCLKKFDSVFSIQSFELDIRKKAMGKPLHIFKYEDENGKALISFEFVDGYWVYNSYWHLEGENSAQKVLLASAKKLNELYPDCTLDINSRTEFTIEEYNKYKAYISNVNIPVYGFTVTNFENEPTMLKAPYYASTNLVTSDTIVKDIDLVDLFSLYSGLTLDNFEDLIKLTNNATNSVKCVGLFVKNKLVCFAYYYEKDKVVYIEYLYTFKEHRSKGYARTLMQHFSGYYVSLHTEEYNPANKLYLSLGLEPTFAPQQYEDCCGIAYNGYVK